MQKPFFCILWMLASLLFSNPIFSQKKELKVKFGKISEEEMAMKSYAPDPDAGAVILFDKGEVKHDFSQERGFIQAFNRHLRVKIFKKEDYWLADQIIQFYRGQKFTDFKASTYNLENGKIIETEIEKAQVFDEKLIKNFSIRKFAMPAIREGSIFEIKYTLSNDDAVGLPDWEFQHPDVPTIWSEFEAEIPTFFEFKKTATGQVPFSLVKEEENLKNITFRFTDHGDRTVNIPTTDNIHCAYNAKYIHYLVENAPALQLEAFSASAHDYLTQIKFQISAVYSTNFIPTTGNDYKIINGTAKVFNESWQGLGHDMHEEWLSAYLESGKFTDEEADKITAGKATAVEKTAAIYAHIGQNFQVKKHDYITKSQSLKSLTEGHRGTATDLNLLCINMLRHSKVNAWPVLVSTRKHGMVLPWNVTPFAFDRVLTAFENEEKQVMLIDASAWPNPLGLLPIEDLNGEGLILKSKDEAGWIPLQNKIPNRDAVVVDLNLTTEGVLTGSMIFSESGFQATDFREKMATSDGKSVVAEKFKGLLANGKMADLTLENAENKQETTLKGTFSLESKSFINAAGGKIYLQPALGLGDQFSGPIARVRKPVAHCCAERCEFCCRWGIGCHRSRRRRRRICRFR